MIARIEMEFSDREPMPGDVAAAIAARQDAEKEVVYVSLR